VKAILLSLTAELVLCIAITARFRSAPIGNRARVMLNTFFAILPLLVAVVLLSPANLGFLPETLTLHFVSVDLIFSLFLYAAGFFGGVLQLYNLADRGFSLRILIDIMESRDGRMSIDQVMQGYSAGHGIDWMYDKRIDGMVRTGLVILHGDRMVLTSKGLRAAGVLAWLQDFLRVPQAKSLDVK
jgi:hypothetical protein